MKEMKGAWENYVVKDKSRFKPLFSFDDIATFDRALYNQINNPLILRLFLEIYNGKQLPKKGVKHLHIWQDWLKTFNKEEQAFLKLLTDEIWLIGKNELLLDDLLKHEILKPYFSSDIISGPYNRLKNIGWISCYVKDLNGYIGFTVEGSLFYKLGIKLSNQLPQVNIDFIHNILKNGTKLQKTAIESFLCEQALKGNLDLVTNLIDAGNEDIDLSITPLLHFLKTFGVKATVEKVLEYPTENDWKALLKLDDQIQELDLQILRKEFLIEVMLENEFEFRDSLKLGLKAIAIIDNKEAIAFMNKVHPDNKLMDGDEKLIFLYAECLDKFGKYDEALEYYEKSLEKTLIKRKENDPLEAILYNNMALVFENKGNYEKALEYHEKSFNINFKLFGFDNSLVITSYNNIGTTFAYKGDNEKALEYFEKCLQIELKTLGGEHHSVATSYNNIGKIFDNNGDNEKALEYFEKSLSIRLKTLGDDDSSVANLYENIGTAIKNKGNCLEAMEYYQKSLAIRLKSFGSDHPDVAISYFSIANCFYQRNEFLNAIEFYKKGFLIKKAGSFPFHIAQCYESINEQCNALDNYIEAASIWKSAFGIEDEDVKKAIHNAKRIANNIHKFNDLPDWIKNEKI
jgi:tetratricopeptide (TPR) repeat protein